MLSPRATRLFLRYFDAIDEAVSRRLVSKRTWDEEALTFLFTELMDKDGQQDHRLSYSHEQLLSDLSLTDEPLSVDVRIETHSYPKSVERWVTQSDIGLILSYQDQFDQDASFQSGWLLQAKRLFLARGRFESGFTTASKFESYNVAQHERMKRLRDWAECDFIRYLLYCPRPSTLEQNIREQLNHARTRRLGGDIFDYTLGLELRDDFLSSAPTTAAGIFVALLDSFPDDLLSVHKNLFSGTTPFSWFIVSQLAQTSGIGFARDMDMMDNCHRGPAGNLNNPVIDGLIRGDIEAIQSDDGLVSMLEDFEQARILPSHTISVRVVNGIDRSRGRSQG